MLKNAWSLLKANKRRTAWIIVVFSFVMFLMGSMPSLYDSIDLYIYAQNSERYGTFHGIIAELTPEQMQTLDNNIFVTELGVVYDAGEQLFCETGQPIRVGGYDETSAALANIPMSEGRLPLKSGEVALENGWKTDHPHLQLGGTITLQLSDGPQAFTICGFTTNYRSNWQVSQYGKILERTLPSAILHEADARTMAQQQHAMLKVSHFKVDELPENSLRGIADTLGKKNSGYQAEYFQNENTYTHTGFADNLNDRIYLVLPIMVGTAAAVFFALRRELEAFRATAGKLYLLGARYRDVLKLELLWLGMLLGISGGIGLLLSELQYLLYTAVTGLEVPLFAGAWETFLVMVGGLIYAGLFSFWHIRPLFGMSYSDWDDRHRVRTPIPLKKGFAYTFARKRKFSNRSSVFWAALATMLIVATLINPWAAFAELEGHDWESNLRRHTLSADILPEFTAYYRYGSFFFWEGAYFDEAEVEALAELPGVAYVDKTYDGAKAGLILPNGATEYAVEKILWMDGAVDSVAQAGDTAEVEALPDDVVATRGYWLWVLDDHKLSKLQQQYPEIDVQSELAKGKCILFCLPDNSDERDILYNDQFQTGDTLRFGMLSADGQEALSYREQTLEVSRMSEVSITLDYVYDEIDVDKYAGLTIFVSEQTAKDLAFADQVGGFKVFMETDCKEQDYERVKTRILEMTEGMYHSITWFDRAWQSIAVLDNHTLRFGVVAATVGLVLVLIYCWYVVWERSMDLYAPSFAVLYRVGVSQRTILRSLLWEGILYICRTAALLIGYLWIVQIVSLMGGGSFAGRIAEAFFTALRQCGWILAAMVPFAIAGAFRFGSLLRKRSMCSRPSP